MRIFACVCASNVEDLLACVRSLVGDMLLRTCLGRGVFRWSLHSVQSDKAWQDEHGARHSMDGKRRGCAEAVRSRLQEVIDGRALWHAFESLDDDGSEEVTAEERLCRGAGPIAWPGRALRVCEAVGL